MRNHYPYLLSLLLLICPCCFIKGQLNHQHNHTRPGDILIKQQIEYKDPGQAGTAILWDYSTVNTLSPEYTVSYQLAPINGDSTYILGTRQFSSNTASDSLFLTGYEHNTRYYYLQTENELLLLGHENSAVRLEYSPFIIQMAYPFNYGDRKEGVYSSDGLYSLTRKINTNGNMITHADAYGILVLPNGDTISPVIRVKTTQLIEEIYKDTKSEKQLETYRWYAKGYRYAILEMVKGIDIKGNTDIFSTGFFFPPQDHLYLDTDPENQKLLDELWKETEVKSQTNREQEETDGIQTISLEDLLECKVYPNPVESVLNLEYEVKQDAKVSFELYSIDGIQVKKIKAQSRKLGTYYETIDCANLYPKNYILRIKANNLFVNHIIIKK